MATTTTFTRRILPTTLGLTIGLSTPFLLRSPPSHYLHCQSDSIPTTTTSWLLNNILKPFRRSEQPPPPPPLARPTTLKTTFNPIYYRQISTGSFLGLVSGWVVARWSRVLVLVIGVVLFLVEFLEYNGVNVIPYGRIQRLVSIKGEDLRRRMLMPENIAFKIAFGAAFCMAAVQSY